MQAFGTQQRPEMMAGEGSSVLLIPVVLVILI